MMNQSCRLGKLGVEVPLGRVDRTKIPAVTVDAGELLYEFPPVRSCAGRVFVPPLNPASRDTLWQVDEAEPQELLLVEYGFTVDWEETAALVRFSAPLLPHIATALVPKATQLAVLTADARLHLVAAPAMLQFARSKGQRPTMVGPLGEEGGVRSLSLAQQLARAGAPTTTHLIVGYAVIGTDQGTLLCLPTDTLDEAEMFELKAGGSGLGKVLFGSFFGKPAGQAVSLLLTLSFHARDFLVAIHEEGQLRLWDVENRTLLYSCDLLPPAVAPTLVPTHGDTLDEPLDSSTTIMLVYYEPRNGEGAGELRAYELFLEERGEAIYKVSLESGPQLLNRIYRLRSMVLEHLSLHTVGAWMLFDDEAGRRRAVCVPLAFGDTAVTAASSVLLIEDQLSEACCAEEDEAMYVALWRSVEAGLASKGALDGASLPPEALSEVFLDVLLSPGRISRAALGAALRSLCGGRSVGGACAEEMAQGDLEDLKRLIPGWVAAATCTAGGGQRDPLATWCALLRHYVAAWRGQHAAIALVQGGPVHTGGLLVMREGSLVSCIRQGVAPELALQAELPADFMMETGRGTCELAALALHAASHLMSLAGGTVLGRLAWACLKAGMDLRGAVLPAFWEMLSGSQVTPPAGGQQGGGRAEWAAWRARCRTLPLQLGRLLNRGDDSMDSFPRAFAIALDMLTGKYQRECSRSPLPAMNRMIAGPLTASAAQVGFARVQSLFQLALLGQYVSSAQVLGSWSLPAEDAQELSGRLMSQADRMLKAAAVGYWAAVTPLPLPIDHTTMDPSQLVIALRIGEGGTGASAPKRARLSVAPGTFVSDLLIRSPVLQSQHVHVVRGLDDLHSVTLRVCELVSGVVAPVGRLCAGEPVIPCRDPPLLVLQVALELFKGNHSSHLASLLRMLPDTEDARLTFLQAWSVASGIPGCGADAAQRQQRVQESTALFFRAAAIFSNRREYEDALEVVSTCIRHLLEDMAGTYKDEGPQVLELQYYETVMMLYERLGCPEAASRFALATTKQVPLALPAPGQALARQQRQGRLWANVFAHAVEDGKYEEAYAAMLSNPVPEVQLDCMQRLVHSLCNAGRVQLLCALPFSATLLVMRDGRETWVTLLDEVVGCLQRRAESLGLDATPQPYKVLYAFHASRGNWQSAASAMLAFSRRLVAEGAGGAGALNQAELALGAAVSALSLVEQSQAWLEDPAGSSPASAQPLFPHLAASKGLAEDGTQPPPAILTLDQLRKEYAVARAHAAVAAAMVGGEATSSQPDDVFSQLLALGLLGHAISLAEGIFEGSRLTRALEQALASQAAHCVRLQLHSGAAGSDGRNAAGGAATLGAHPGLGFAAEGADGMDEDATPGDAAAAADGAEGGEEREAAASAAWQQDAAGPAGAAATLAAAAWRQLKRQLARFEGGEHGSRLRLLIVEAILATEQRMGLPPWLLAPFKAGSGDVAGLMRVLMRFDRLEEAAQLACLSLELSMRSVPSISMQRMGQQYHPHALLQELASRLEVEARAGAEGAKQRHEQLMRALQAETEAAARQTAVIGQLFA